MSELTPYKDLPIDWDMGPADAVAFYLEWGNTGYSGRHMDPEKETYYFSIDTWQEPFTVRLQKMTKDGSETLHEIELPRKFWSCCNHAKGVYPVPTEVREWLETLFY
jgi:hypothetical protein